MWIVLLSACGEVSTASHADAAIPSHDDAASDSADAPTILDAATLGPWSTPALIGTLSSSFTESHPAISADGCEIYFTSNRDGNNTDIWMSSRFNVSEPWSAPHLVSELDATSTSESGPELSNDGKTIYFARAVVGSTTGYDIYSATRAGPSAPWSQVALVNELDTDGHERSPHLSSDGTKIWYAHYNGTDYDIWTATRSSPTATWTNPHEVQRLTSTSDDEGPTTSGDGLTMYFNSTRDGSDNVYTSTINSNGGWTVPTIVPELEGAQWVDITPDGRYMVMAISTPSGGLDLYESNR